MAKIDNSRDNNDKNLFFADFKLSGWRSRRKNDGSFGFYCSHHYRNQRLRASRSMVNEQLWRNLKKMPHFLAKMVKRFANFQSEGFQGKENTDYSLIKKISAKREQLVQTVKSEMEPRTPEKNQLEKRVLRSWKLPTTHVLSNHRKFGTGRHDFLNRDLSVKLLAIAKKTSNGSEISY